MTETDLISAEDLHRLADLGISSSEIDRQLSLFRCPPPLVRLLRPCRSGDGIVRLSSEQQAACIESWQMVHDRNRLLKFVPASGAATRMFENLTPSGTAVTEPHAAVVRFRDHIADFAFRDTLQAALACGEHSLDSVVEDWDGQALVTALLEASGLGYGKSPKGLILFHRYPEGPRSALEDHLREGAPYLSPPGGVAHYHFTVTESHQSAFAKEVSERQSELETQLGLSLRVGFSIQSPATDTIAVEQDGSLVRRTDGSLLLRPAGHGALLRNLQNLDADVVFIRNIDNIAHGRLHPLSVYWKQVLAGYFSNVQGRIFDILEKLETQPESTEWSEQAISLLQRDLAVELPAEIVETSPKERRIYLIDRLDRPLRVCGMVKNEGEPGGGPFWLQDLTRAASGQIVEPAQVDLADPNQASIWERSTHFNPVDLVCGLRNRNGAPYRLGDFVDPTTSLIADKSHQGRPIKALERPGLWNGSMAGWNTAFLEVPLETFTPVKTVFDLLRPQHQP